MDAGAALFRTATAAGLEVCFANPGTSELPLVAAMDSAPGMKAILCLFEGVATGAADGYARMKGRPALTLLHTGPGFANGLANLHNANRANSPMVNLVGDQPTWHRKYDPPLHCDIERAIGGWSKWTCYADQPDKVPSDLVRAVEAAMAAPGRSATLIVPLDSMWADVAGPAPAPKLVPPRAVPDDRIEAIAAVLKKAGKAGAMMLEGPAMQEKGLWVAWRIAAATGCRLLADWSTSRLDRGLGVPVADRVPYFPPEAMAFLEGMSDLVMVGSHEPITFFGYREYRSTPAPVACVRHTLAHPNEDLVGAMEAVADLLGAPKKPALPPFPGRPARPTGKIDAQVIGEAIGALLPENAILVDEGVSGGRPSYLATAGAPRHTYLSITGGAIGFGLPCSTGAAVACPDSRVVDVQADGSAMYTVQSLWTQAREGLNVTTVILANQSYAILDIERERGGFPPYGPMARGLTELARPHLDWVALAKGMGVPGKRVTDGEALCKALEESFAEPGPRLIEAVY